MRPETRADKLANEAITYENQGKWESAAEKWGAASLAHPRRKKEYAERRAACLAKAGPPLDIRPLEVLQKAVALTHRQQNDDRLVESAKLLEEAMGEIERLQKETPEVGHLQAQVFELQEEVKRLRGGVAERGLGCSRICPKCDGADDCPCEACHGAPVRTQIDLRGSEEVKKLLDEAQVEIEGLQDKLAALPREEEWKRICEAVGAEDGEGVAEVTANIRSRVGDEHKADDLDDAIEHVLQADEEDKEKAEAFDRCKGGLGLEIADALRKVLSSHECRLRQAWLNLDVYEQKRIMGAMESQIETWLDGDCK